jgi:RNA-splicing ligase RtcB
VAVNNQELWDRFAEHILYDLDETPMAYKDIEQVMKDQEDLVTPVTRLTPLAVVKG